MDATKLAKELIDLHDHPRQVAPFSTRYPGLTAETGFEGLPLQGLCLNFEP